MIKNLLEHGGLKQAHASSVVDDVPNDGGTIIRRGNSLSVVLVDLDVRDSSSVLLERSLHDLSLSTNSPDSNFTFHASRDNLLAVSGSGNSSNSMVVSVVNGKQKLS